MKTYLLNLTLLIIFLLAIFCQSCDDGDKGIGCQQFQFPTERCGWDFGSIKLGCTDVNVTLFHFDNHTFHSAQKTDLLYQIVMKLNRSMQENLSVQESKIKALKTENRELKQELRLLLTKTDKKTDKVIADFEVLKENDEVKWNDLFRMIGDFGKIWAKEAGTFKALRWNVSKNGKEKQPLNLETTLDILIRNSNAHSATAEALNAKINLFCGIFLLSTVMLLANVMSLWFRLRNLQQINLAVNGNNIHAVRIEKYYMH